ncbi:MAG TPA: DUF72 domain-containing protein [Candidatus Limnocylindria bacterium]|nr:DUF72 domain-containing protein [Candidatus Limnocylindria bacterium]
MAGRLYVGTSGFAYPDWRPTFYPATARPSQLLSLYAARLPAVELNNTFYQQPKPERVAAWLEQTPTDFRFVVKAQRGGSLRAFASAATETMEWLTGPYRRFGERLGTVLLRVPGNVARDDARLAALLEAWPAEMPLTVELQHASWRDDEVLAALSARGVALCATDLDDAPPPDVRLSGRFLYLRLRRAFYSPVELEAWAARLLPFLEDGRDAYVFMRHDAGGESALRAVWLRGRVARRLTSRGA